jgi:hypothetical protein
MAETLKKLGPYQFFELERWERFMRDILPLNSGTYLLVLKDPKKYYITEHAYRVYKITVHSADNIVCLPTKESFVERLARHNAPVSTYSSVFLVDADMKEVTKNAKVSRDNFFKFVHETYQKLWK